MKVRIGDIIEIRTSRGLAYAIYTHRHDKPPRYGALLRVFDRLFSSRPDALEEIAKLPVRFSTFFPLQAATNRGLVEVVGNVSVPENLAPFPVFRAAGLPDLKTKKVHAWWLWDGVKEWRVGALTPEQRKLPIRGAVNDTMLVSRIEKDWRPENDPR